MNDVSLVLPEAVVVALATLVVVIDAIMGPRTRRDVLALVVVAGLIVALAAGPLVTEPRLGFSGLVLVDTFTTFFRVLFIVLAGLTVLISPAYLARHAVPAGEFYATVLFATVGGMTIALANDLVTLFVGLELMSIPIYVLAGMQRRDRASNEAALKYFLLGAFSSALLVYGFAWLYGVTGTTELGPIAAALGRSGLTDGPTIVALSLITVGLGFKAAAVPFHQWTPDAYDGAPTPATAFMSVAPKAAAFAAILRIMVGGLSPLGGDWTAAFAILALVTMTLGNVVALAQTNVKRMLAYSSIAHTGYILAGLAAFTSGDPANADAANASVIFYAFAYGVMNLGAFAALLYLATEGTRGATLDELNGFAKRNALGALTFAVFLISLTGIPPTVGFWAKVFVIQPVLDADLTWLAVAIALNAVVAAFYYLRVVVHMYMYDADAKAPALVSPRLLDVSLGISAAAVVVLGILPDALYRWALDAAAPLVVR
ncbi:MAG TPA: NADH-quinone oxidoreductase subunit N [Candidatus Limnocylindria bacterium]|nr:NADH-quinone oxidoreductase subunit N [Candidatus Limnocylindria bacterium]